MNHKKYRAKPLAVVTFILSTFAALPASAGITPLGVAIFPPVQFPPYDFTIIGARASVIMGRHLNVYGVDIGGIGNVTQQNFTGLAVSGLFNQTNGMTTVLGLQLAGAANLNYQKTRVYGAQVAAVNSNVAESSVVGAQVGLANLADYTTVWILQAGVYNRAREVYGFQVGLINAAETLHGIQIGLLNFNRTGAVSVSPIINIGF